MSKVIWTNHLYERLKQRGIDPRWVDDTVRFPDRVERSSTTDSNKHIKIIHGFEIVAAVKRQGSDWVITSAWWKPVYGHSTGRSHPAQHQKRFFLEEWIYRGLTALEKKITGRK
ncbi:MAG: hypothetical protein UW62_C0030G0007 [Candidatus Collierbacteria bacterium GW2011_GWB1_44_35]|uniref:Uncharacterized protein n=3 Tax=Candidatus Collieribacteriota TaxID=1752725 RepID=A0A0G1P4M4_9BACT|nr:MAG: hypothetical protein UW26_C0022G0005 [Candidatus Collierbacteria bacterium GW2011_GWF1_44_12]KKT67185.1 MAG: hypothetical protein UW62_C0030G0007 [Candidatus Collierbacteria bacterium GW2011_GWB1_44_35]KKU27676.1 MAG: hypothetical protein UX41_C0045G0004 [Candidatus Collierbacteria bacterium GW2011_GWE1_46_18]